MAHQLKILLLLLVFHDAVSGQQLSPQTLNSAGKSSTGGGVILDDAVGGFAINIIATSSFMYTQDFLQPDAGVTAIIPPINNVVLVNRYGVDNAGTTFIAGSAMIEFTVGEPASITLNGGSNMLTQGILQPSNTIGILPVTGLEFYAKRINNTQVQLDWITLQKINNKGFHIERKKENENDFSKMDFVHSNTNGGNSSFPLQYQKLDDNSFAGSTYYRLKQEDYDGKTTYSIVRLVKGDISKRLTMQVWPVPAIGFFNVSVNGLDKADVLQVVDMSGRVVKQFTIQNQMQQQVNGLPAGTYFVNLAGDKTVGQRVIVQ